MYSVKKNTSRNIRNDITFEYYIMLVHLDSTMWHITTLYHNNKILV